MARPRSISDEQILDAAREVFLERGLSATTAEIAARAGVSEGSIFRRFATKDRLFFASMGMPQSPAWMTLLEEIREAQDIHEALLELATALVAFFIELVPRMALMMSASQGRGQLPIWDRDDPPVMGLRALTELFDHWQRQGKLRPCDPEILARMLVASCNHYGFCHVSRVNDWLPMPGPSYVRGVVDMLLRGVAPETNEE